jgi:hypothetical protein
VRPAGAEPLAELAEHVDEVWVATPDAAAPRDESHGDHEGERAGVRSLSLDAGRSADDDIEGRRERSVSLDDPAAVMSRLAALAARPPRVADPACAPPRELRDADVRVLATPAWRGEDRLPELLAAWCAATAPEMSACLYLLADPGCDGTPEEIERRVLAAAAATGADLDACADVEVLIEPIDADRDARLHRAIPLYVPLHACAGHERIARVTGGEVVEPGALAARLAASRAPALV